MKIELPYGDGVESLVVPPAIGVDLLWSEITTWVSGATSYEDFAKTIDTARDELAS